MNRQLLMILTALLALAACSGAESRKARFVERAEALAEQRDYHNARLEFRNALQIDAKDSKVLQRAGEVAEKLAEFDEAAALYQTALKADKGNVKARADLARLYVFGSLPAQAEKLVEEGLAAAATDPDLIAVRGAARQQLGDSAGALADAERAIQIAPGNENAAALLVSLYSQANRSADARRVATQALRLSPQSLDLRVILAQLDINAGDAPAAEAQLAAVVQLDSRNLSHRYRLAQFYLLQKNVDAAERTLRAAVTTQPEDVPAKLALANLIAAHRSFAAAEKSLRDLIAQSGNSLALQLGLGQFYETHGKLDKAEESYRAVIAANEKGPQGLTARNRIAAMALGANRSADAAKLLQEVLAASPRDNDALVMRANLALARGDAPMAITDLRAVLRDQPNAPTVLRGLARAYVVNKNATLAEETLRQAVQANPRDVGTRLELAQFLIESGRADQAQPVVDQLVTDQPGNTQGLEAAFRVQMARKDIAGARVSAAAIRTVDPKQPLGYYLGGLIDQAENKLDAARASYGAALAVSPDAAEPLAAVVRVDLALKHPDQALARIDAVLVHSPKNAMARNLKGEVLLQLGRNDEAIKCFEETIALTPQWWTPYRGVATAQLAAKRRDAGIAAYRRGIEITLAPPLITELASVFERLDQPQAAIAEYEAWLKRDPQSDIAANNLGMLLVTHRGADNAARDQALALTARFADSRSPALLDTYGWVRYVRGEYAEAIPVLQRAVDLAPRAALLRYHLGMAQYKAGQSDAARQNLSVAVAAGASYTGIDEARKTLAALSPSA
jgi:tetratricopeptide (TPR) repeat protein